MKHSILAIASLATVLCGSPATAEDKPPPKPPTASLYAGACLNPGLNGPKGAGDTDNAGFLAGLALSAGSKLIGAGLDWVGRRLAALGEDERTTVSGARAAQVAYDDRTCLQLARWSTEGQTLSGLITARKDAGWTWPKQDATPVHLDRSLDLFVELWVRPSDSGKGVSLTPTLLYYPKQLAKSRNGNDASPVVIAAKLEPVGFAAGSVTWALPTQRAAPGQLQVFVPMRTDEKGATVRQRVGDLQSYCDTGCEMASPWIANPWANAKLKAADAGLAKGVGGSGDTVETATNISVDFTEIRPGSKFFKALAEAYTTAKPDIQSEVQQLVFDEARESADAKATTTLATALVTFSGKMAEADASREKYCAAKGKSGTTIMGLSADLGAKQRLANVAAGAAKISAPFAAPAATSSSFDAAQCSA